jgi:hypothetical protein
MHFLNETLCLYAFFCFPIHATCSTHLILFDLITKIIFGEKQKSWSSSLCNFLQSSVKWLFLILLNW